MKVLLLTLVSSFLLASNAQAKGAVRVFNIDWKQDSAHLSDVQVCDDNYYKSAELLVSYPYLDYKEVKAQVDQCPGLKLSSRVDEVSNGDDVFQRLTLKGNWDGCELKFTSKKSEEGSSKTYTVYLGDGC